MPIIPMLLLAVGPGFLIQDRPVPSVSMNGSAASLVAAELGFAKQAEVETTRAAFLAVLDENGVLFRPGPVNGRAWLAPRKPDATRLGWYPAFVAVSRAGDLGYSTGPYEWRAEAGAKDVAHGQFVSIWGRQGGDWKLLLDVGISHAAPAKEIPLFKPLEPRRDTKPLPSGATSNESLSRQERAFAEEATHHGLAAAYRRFAAADLRFYRDGTFPLTQLKEALAPLSPLGARPGPATWTCLGSGVSISGDLGYTYGITALAGVEPPTPHTFLHVWKRAQPRGWQLVLDLETPLPPEKPKS